VVNHLICFFYIDNIGGVKTMVSPPLDFCLFNSIGMTMSSINRTRIPRTTPPIAAGENDCRSLVKSLNACSRLSPRPLVVISCFVSEANFIPESSKNLLTTVEKALDATSKVVLISTVSITLPVIFRTEICASDKFFVRISFKLLMVVDCLRKFSISVLRLSMSTLIPSPDVFFFMFSFRDAIILLISCAVNDILLIREIIPFRLA